MQKRTHITNSMWVKIATFNLSYNLPNITRLRMISNKLSVARKLRCIAKPPSKTDYVFSAVTNRLVMSIILWYHGISTVMINLTTTVLESTHAVSGVTIYIDNTLDNFNWEVSSGDLKWRHHLSIQKMWKLGSSCVYLLLNANVSRLCL